MVSTKIIAGVIVPDTPLITKALEFARENLSTLAFNHVVRSWLFGAFIADQTPHLRGRDNELHAVAAILHDLGWSKNTQLISEDKRFEVDSANATRDFLIREGKKEEWDERRLQIAWDAVALHTNGSIARHKEIEVQACLFGIGTDFAGLGGAPGGVLTQAVWDMVVKEYPRVGFSDGVKEIICGFCITKPQTTYGTFMADFGLKFVDGYNEEGHRVMDRVLAAQD